MFTIACIMLLCAYFQGSLLLQFCLTRRWEKDENRNKKKKKMRSCITHTWIDFFFLLLLSIHRLCVCVFNRESSSYFLPPTFFLYWKQKCLT
jgi:hypothetical protein